MVLQFANNCFHKPLRNPFHCQIPPTNASLTLLNVRMRAKITDNCEFMTQKKEQIDLDLLALLHDYVVKFQFMLIDSAPLIQV